MNKENLSWIHYAYITITASVLAYVTYADNGTEESTSALDMLPNNTLFNESQNSPMDIPVATEVTENSPEPEVEIAPELEVATESKINNVNGGKLKKTRTNTKKYKKKQTRSRR